jgi:ubiquinone/menaquinone biosynthesis C-methylase UbiE
MNGYMSANQHNLREQGYYDVKAVDRRLSLRVARSSFVVLDVGGEVGRDSIPLTRKCAYAINLDVDSSCLREAKLQLPTLECLRASVLFLPFKSEVFDLVTCFSVIDHLITKRNAQAAILELSRVARKDGFVVVTVPNRLFILGTIGMEVKNILELRRRYEQRFTPSELRKMLTSCNLKPIIYDSTYPTTLASMHSILWFNLPRIVSRIPGIMSALTVASKILSIVEGMQVFRLVGARMGYLTKKTRNSISI